ncbi:targeting protein for Xklp2-like [Bombus pascuorum]|uniref:targeting protein for Xklp2-like n=1 Tax=Bombus pascuorum TaxID=65598 RepID=UPI00298D9573|nr:targeting protein for Xklp2-like [Bombus pascuorum]XP_060817185.1 targeting protein for Xklp2-like [Bombus pascuorum]
MDTKSEQTLTPIGVTKNDSKVPFWKFWQENIKLKSGDTNSNHRAGYRWRNYRNSKKDDNWDEIESPQFVDFFNPPDIADSFFNKAIVTTSTPYQNHTNTKHPNTIADDETLVASLNNFYLSDITPGNDEKTYVNSDDSQSQEKEKYVVHNARKLEPKANVKASNKTKMMQKIGVVYPFTFDLRKKNTQDGKQENIKKILKDENKVKKIENSNNCDKIIKKSTDLWKKPPFVPQLSRQKLPPPKSPPLHTASRAQERKRFDENIQKKNKQKEQMIQMAIAAKKKQEEEEIALLRKQMVHKAQPIHKYKIGLPKINKRPLTDPVSPIVLKRRRRI